MSSTVKEIINNPFALYVSFGMMSVLYVTSCIISGKAQNEDKKWDEIKDDMITSFIVSCVASLVLFIILGGVVYSNKLDDTIYYFIRSMRSINIFYYCYYIYIIFTQLMMPN